MLITEVSWMERMTKYLLSWDWLYKENTFILISPKWIVRWRFYSIQFLNISDRILSKNPQCQVLPNQFSAAHSYISDPAVSQLPPGRQSKVSSHPHQGRLPLGLPERLQGSTRTSVLAAVLVPFPSANINNNLRNMLKNTHMKSVFFAAPAEVAASLEKE